MTMIIYMNNVGTNVFEKQVQILLHMEKPFGLCINNRMIEYVKCDLNNQVTTVYKIVLY